ncbi:hypothetical protein HAX54_033846 [Datura stramonium]|uniref:Uncharacterized protein n=1 Tax=Datura stramonium TaxID=4076 RepID=A0ABS8VFS8_DATST|nr:hypothetical protein [Datura stramonium]
MGRRTRVPTQKALEFAEMAGQQRKKEGATKVLLPSSGKEVTGGKIGGSTTNQLEFKEEITVEDIPGSPKVRQSTDLQVREGSSVRKVGIPTSPTYMQPTDLGTVEGNSLRNVPRKRNTSSKDLNQILQHTGSQTEEGTGIQQGEEASASHQKAIHGRQMEAKLLVDQGRKSKNTAISVGVWVAPAS